MADGSNGLLLLEEARNELHGSRECVKLIGIGYALPGSARLGF
jgi:hypothetical protein